VGGQSPAAERLFDELLTRQWVERLKHAG
jgi:hypothetical protein